MDATSTSSEFGNREVPLPCGSDVATIDDKAALSLFYVAGHTFTWHPRHRVIQSYVDFSFKLNT